jgi:hypothetical protein
MDIQESDQDKPDKQLAQAASGTVVARTIMRPRAWPASTPAAAQAGDRRSSAESDARAIMAPLLDEPPPLDWAAEDRALRDGL